MKVTVQRADIRKEKHIIIDLLRKSINPVYEEDRFDWLYQNSPNGSGRAWMAIDQTNDQCIGVAAAFPRNVTCGGQETTAWVLGDFCLDAQYRSLGPALRLQRACLSVLDMNEGAFCYDFPSASMTAVYKRLGFSVTGQMLRLAKPLRVDRKVKQIIKNPAAQRVVASVGNTLLKIASPRGASKKSLEVSIHPGFCDEEFTVLAQEQRGKFGLCLERSAEYLNWRYISNPLARHEIVTARRNGRLVGYIVWTRTGEDAAIIDLFGEDDSRMGMCLVAEIMNLALNCGLITVSVSMNESHPRLSLFCEMGFRLRDSVPLVIIPSKTFPHKLDPKLTGWYLMQGDRDS